MLVQIRRSVNENEVVMLPVVNLGTNSSDVVPGLVENCPPAVNRNSALSVKRAASAQSWTTDPSRPTKLLPAVWRRLNPAAAGANRNVVEDCCGGGL